MDTTFSEAIKTSKTALKQSRDMIKYKGGIATDDKGLVALPEMIRTIPGTGVTTVTAFNTDINFLIPQGTTKYAYLAEFGGMTWSDAEQAGEFIPDGMLYDEALESFYFGGDVDWDEVPEDDNPHDVVIPPEILALPDYGQGINLQYYNKVDLVEQKYKKCIVTMTFDGSEGLGTSIGWQEASSFGNPTAYARIRIGEYGQYAADAVVCDKLPYSNITSSTTAVGVDVIQSKSGDGAPASFLAVRPPNASSIDAYDFIKWLKANPITVRVALTVPEVFDLPVYMNPLIYLGVLADVANDGGEAYFEGLPNDGYGYPVKIIFETIDSQGG